MKSLTLFFTLCLLASCERKEQIPLQSDLKNPKLPTEQIPTPVGLKSSELPTAIHSRLLEEKESHYIEIVISDDKSEIFHEGKPVATTTTPDQLYTEIKQLWDKNNTMGYTSPLLIGAPGSTPFKTIADQMRTAANTGIYQILFLVQSDQASEARVVFTDLASMSQPSPKIDPYFLHITSNGHVYSGTGESRIQMDNGTQDQQLDKLSENLQLFSSAAKAAGISSAPCQIYIEPNATYQRAIDVISLTNKYQIKPFFTYLIEEPEVEQFPGPKKKPSSPSSRTKPLELAPKE